MPGEGLNVERKSHFINTTSMFQVSQVGEVLRALGTNPTEGEVKKLIQSTVTVSWIHDTLDIHNHYMHLSSDAMQALVCKQGDVCNSLRPGHWHWSV